MPIAAAVAGIGGSIGVPGALMIAGGLGAAGAVGSALIQSNAASKASAAQVALGQQALTMQQQNLQPFLTNAQGAGNVLNSLLTPGPNQTKTLSQIPGFQFAQDWGQQAVKNQATSTGLGGNALTAGASYATGLAQQNFGNLINPLLSLYQTGGSAAGALTSAETGTLTGIGNAQAAGTLGSANALAAGLTGATGSLSNAFLLNSMLSRIGAPGGNSPGGTGIYSAGANPLAYPNAPFSAGGH